MALKQAPVSRRTRFDSAAAAINRMKEEKMNQLTYDEINILIEALDSWESKDAFGDLAGGLLDAMFSDKLSDEDKAKRKEEKRIKDMKAERDRRERKDQSVLIKAKGKSEVIKELKSTKETLDLRKSTLNKQEGRTREKLNELQSKVQNAIKLSGNSET